MTSSYPIDTSSLLSRETTKRAWDMSLVLYTERALFSGDSLVTGYPTITRLPGGSKREYAENTLPYLQSLNSELLVYPGHGSEQPLGQYNLCMP